MSTTDVNVYLTALERIAANPTLRSGEKLVGLIVLTRLLRESRSSVSEISISRAEIAESTGLSEVTVTRSLKLLAQAEVPFDIETRYEQHTVNGVRLPVRRLFFRLHALSALEALETLGACDIAGRPSWGGTRVRKAMA